MLKINMLKKVKKFKLASIPLGLFIVLFILIVLTFEVIFDDKFLPRVYVGDSHLGILSKSEAYRLLDAKYNQRLKSQILFGNSTIDLSTASAKIKISEALDKAFQIGHQNPLHIKLYDQIKILLFGYNISPEIELSDDKQLTSLAKTVYKSPKDATLEYGGDLATTSAQIKITDGKTGLELDQATLSQEIENYIIYGIYSSKLPMKIAQPKITNEKVKKAKEFIEQASSNPVKLTFEGRNWELDAKTLITLINLEGDLLIDEEKLLLFISEIASKIDQPIQEGQFNFNQLTGRVSEFQPSQEGKELDREKSATLISLALEGKRARTISLPVNITKPKITTENVNSLGIKELLGRGISHFSGSIPNRIYNVGLTASRINGVLIPPGEIFSFNNTVGEVSGETGFKQAYVIKSGRTVLDDGGGVCQDSTTLFRAVLNAGLPVVSRTAHAYRVGYYEQGFPPGLDATVFHPTVDFKFQNDTPAHILIQAYTSGTTLFIDLYGTSDGRVSTISKPSVTNQIPPPEDLRQDDPELPKGTIKQVDWSAWGATVTFTRNVKRGGETLMNETYKSIYKPWQAVYLVGTKEN